MRLFDDGALLLFLDAFGTLDQDTDSASFRLPLGHDDDNLALGQLPAPMAVDLALGRAVGRRTVPGLGKAAPDRGEAGGHEGGAGEDEADGAPIDADGGESGRVAVDEAEVGDDGPRGAVGLEEEGDAVDGVEDGAVGELDGGEVGLFGEDGVDVRGEEGEGGEDALADAALDRGLELGFGARGDAGWWGRRGCPNG